MAKPPKPKSDQKRTDAVLRETFQRIEAQPIPQDLIKQVAALSGQGRRKTQ